MKKRKPIHRPSIDADGLRTRAIETDLRVHARHYYAYLKLSLQRRSPGVFQMPLFADTYELAVRQRAFAYLSSYALTHYNLSTMEDK